MSSDLVFWKGTESLENWGDQPHTKEGRQKGITVTSLSIIYSEKCMSCALKNDVVR